jgi:hypothetical protein
MDESVVEFYAKNNLEQAEYKFNLFFALLCSDNSCSIFFKRFASYLHIALFSYYKQSKNA